MTTTDQTETTEQPPVDPVGEPIPMPPKGASREEIAVAAYEMFGTMMQALGMKADHTKAKNYVGVVMEGMLAPFDRVEIHFMRPGGLTPIQRVDHFERRVDFLEEERKRYITANAEIAVELADRITGGSRVEGEERFLQVLRSMESTIMTLREAQRGLELRSGMALAAVKTARDALLGNTDHGEAVRVIDDLLEQLGVAL